MPRLSTKTTKTAKTTAEKTTEKKTRPNANKTLIHDMYAQVCTGVSFKPDKIGKSDEEDYKKSENSILLVVEAAVDPGKSYQKRVSETKALLANIKDNVSEVFGSAMGVDDSLDPKVYVSRGLMSDDKTLIAVELAGYSPDNYNVSNTEVKAALKAVKKAITDMDPAVKGVYADNPYNILKKGFENACKTWNLHDKTMSVGRLSEKNDVNVIDALRKEAMKNKMPSTAYVAEKSDDKELSI